MYYTGVGSRDVSQEEFEYMVLVGRVMAKKGYKLRSGAAKGADQAFQIGACMVNPNLTEIWLPWFSFGDRLDGDKRFEGSKYYVPTPEQFEKNRNLWLETEIISWFEKMKQGAQKLHGRNANQVIGHDDELSKVCIYCADIQPNGEPKGGTRSAVLLSKHYSIPTYNIRNDVERRKLSKILGLPEEF